MSEPLWVLIALRAAIVSLAVLVAILAVLSVAHAFRGERRARDIVGRVVGGAILFGIPIGVATFFGMIASALLLAVGAPPPTYIFTALASLVTLRTAINHPGDGMSGCTKLFGLVASAYAFAWSIVSFEATGGVGAIGSGAISARWVQPFLAALPFALLVLRLTAKRKRNLWLFTGFFVFVAAYMALAFFPIENGLAASILPRSDWLRFPLAGAAIALVLSLVPLSFALRASPNVRRTRLRDLRRKTAVLVAIMLAMGLSWALARAIVGALQVAV